MSSPAVENGEVQSIPSAESMRADIAGASVEAMDFKLLFRVTKSSKFRIMAQRNRTAAISRVN